MIEKYLGEDLTAEMYNQLSDTEKDGIAKDIASFLVYLHNKHSKGPVDNFELINDDPRFIYAKERLTEQEHKELADKIEQVNSRDKSDEFQVLSHRDIKGQNVLYDRETKKVAITGLTFMSNDNIYRDFVPYDTADFGLSYDLLFNIVDYYNKSSDIKVSKDKIKLLHELGIWHEYVRCSISKNTYDKTSKLGDLEAAYERNLKK